MTEQEHMDYLAAHRADIERLLQDGAEETAILDGAQIWIMEANNDSD